MNYTKTLARGIAQATLGLAMIAMASNAFATKPTLTYGKNGSPSQDGSSGGAFELKLENDSAVLYSFNINPPTNPGGFMVRNRYIGNNWNYSSNYAVQNGFSGVIYDGKFSSKYTTKSGGKKLIYIKDGQLKVIYPTGMYGNTFSTLSGGGEDIELNSANIISYNESEFTNIRSASIVHNNKQSLLWLSSGIVYSSQAQLGNGDTPSVTMVSNGVDEAKSFGEFFFLRKGTEIYFVGGATQTMLVRVIGESNLDFLKDKNKVIQTSTGVLLKINADKSFFAYKNNQTSSSSALVPKFIGLVDGGRVAYVDDMNRIVIADATFGPLEIWPNTINPANVKSVVGTTYKINRTFDYTPYNGYITNITPFANAVAMYVDISNKLHLVPASKNGSSSGNIYNDWSFDFSKEYISSESYTASDVGFASFGAYKQGFACGNFRSTAFGGGLAYASLGSSSPNLTAGSGCGLPASHFDSTNALNEFGLFISGNSDGIVRKFNFDVDTNTWLVSSTTLLLPNFNGVLIGARNDGSTVYVDYLDRTTSEIKQKVLTWANINEPVGLNWLSGVVSTVWDLSKYENYWNTTYANGETPFVGTPAGGGKAISKASGNLVSNSVAYGSAANDLSYDYVCIDRQNYDVKTTTYNDLLSPYNGFTNSQSAYLGGMGDSSVAMLNDGSLRFSGSSSAEVLESPYKNFSQAWVNTQYGFCGATEFPLSSNGIPSFVRAGKGSDNSKIVVNWASVGQNSTYSVKRGYGGYQATVATGITTTSYEDLDTTGGSNPSSPMNYQITSNSATNIYKTKNGPLLWISSGASYGGCAFTDGASKECSGWRGNSPTLMSLPPMEVTANSINQAMGTPIVSDLDNPYDVFTYSVSVAPSNGSTSIDANGKVLYTPTAGYAGADAFTVVVTDKAGNTLSGVQNVNVVCPLPVITSLNVPTTYPGLSTQIATALSSSNSCLGTLKVSVKVTNRTTLQEVTSAAILRTGQATGVAKTSSFTLSDLMPGNYTIDATIESEKAGLTATHKATKSLNFSVDGFGTFDLALNKALYSEDDLVQGSVSSTGCVINTAGLAKSSGQCYVVWNNASLNGVTYPTVSSVNGYGNVGNDYPISADIFKYSSNLVAVKIGSVNNVFTVLPGLPTQLKPITFAKPIARWIDKVSFLVERDSGYDCQIVKTAPEALTLAQAGKKVCLFEATLPVGLVYSNTARGLSVDGRIDAWASETPNTTISYKLSKFYSGKAPFVMEESTITIPVVNFTMTSALTTNKASYAANSTPAVITPKLSDFAPATANACNMYTKEAESGTSYLTDSVMYCYTEWKQIPPGLVVDTTSTSPKLIGKPTLVGANPIGYEVYAIKPNGAGGSVREVIGSYSGTLTVTDLTPLSLSMGDAANGTIDYGNGDVRYLVDDTGKVGSVTLVGGDFSTIKMTVTESGSAPQVFAGLKAGDTKLLTLGAGQKGAWVTRNASVRVEYEEVAVATAVTTPLVATQLPAASVVTKIALPSIAPNDTDPFTLTATVGSSGAGGSIAYSPTRDGAWKVALYAKQGMGLVPMTGFVVPDSMGVATFSSLQYSDYVGQEIYSGATWSPPANTTLSIPDRSIQSPTGIKLNFVLGGALQALSTVGRVTGEVPLKQTFDVNLTGDGALALKQVIWHISDDEMETWKPLGVTGRAATYTFVKGGVYYVKGQMTNKFTNMVSWSEPVSFVVKEVLSATIDGENLYLPGTPVTLTLNVKAKDGSPMADYDVKWEVVDSGGAVVEYTNVPSVAIESAIPATFTINALVKSKTMSENDPSSWTALTKSVVFFASSKPKVSVSGPRLVEAGKIGAFKARAIEPWSGMKGTTKLKVVGKWVFPDGTNATGDTANYSPRAEDGSVQKVRYEAWVEGLEEETKGFAEATLSITSYVFPNFVFKGVVDTLYAPAYLKLVATPETPFDVAQMKGKKLTYTWTSPETFSGTGAGANMRGFADLPGTYDFNLKVEDDRGNSQVLDYQLVLEASRPWVLTAKLLPALKFNRAPMNFTVKPVLSGGHPKDRIQTVETFVNDVSMGIAKALPRAVTMATPGLNTYKINMTSIMGGTATVSVEANVNPNQPPQCSMDEIWDKKGTTVKLTPKCVDPDGRIAKVVWYQDGVKLNKSAAYLYVTMTEALPSTMIRGEMTDDAGAMVSLEKLLTYVPPVQ